MKRTDSALDAAWPSGGFQWAAEWERLFPVVRGVHVPQMPEIEGPTPTLPATPAGFEPARVMPALLGAQSMYLGGHAGLPAAQLEALVAGASSSEAWQDLLAQACAAEMLDYGQRPGNYLGDDRVQESRARDGYAKPVPWMVRRCLQANGPLATLRIALALWRCAPTGMLPSHSRQRWCLDLFGPLRHALARADDATCDAAAAIAGELRDAAVSPAESAYLARACAHVFPHRADWAAACMAHDEAEREPLLLTCAMPGGAFLRYLQLHPRLLQSGQALRDLALSGLLLQLKLDPEAGFAALAHLLRDAFTRDEPAEINPLLALASRAHEPGLLPLLASGHASKRVRSTLERLAKTFPAAVLRATMGQALAGRNRAAEAFAVRLARSWPQAVPAALAALEPGPRSRMADILAALERAPVAPEALPAILREPPWARAHQPRPLPVVAAVPIATPHGLSWSAEDDYNADHYTSFDSPWRHLRQHGVAGLPDVISRLVAHPGSAPRLLAKVDAPELVAPLLHVLRNVRLHHATAAEWLCAHPKTAAMAALPAAFGATAGAARDDARHGLCWLAQHDQSSVLHDAADAYGPAMRGALDQLLATDPIDFVPEAMPVLAGFFDTDVLHRPELRAGGALPPEALRNIALMLAISRIDAPYAGLALVRQACTPASLAEFAWDLYESWFAAGRPAAGRWAFHGLALLGNDETVRRLVSRINEWAAVPGMRGLANDALDLLAALGSDVALSRLHGIATRSSYKRAREHANGLIHRVAQQRGLGLEQLGDRLAPTFGLEEPDAQVLDFGPRRFFVVFDQALAAHVQDERGQRLKDLPKPNKGDDAERAAAAAERFKSLRKDLKATASLQVTRLERAMVWRRRWPAGEFLQLFARHPLVRHLASRLVWGTYDGSNRLERSFRVCEDGSLSDASDTRVALAEDAVVGIAHRLELDRPLHAAWCRHFGEYELEQPFRQLVRETYALSEAEGAQPHTDRFDGRDVATGAVIGLDQKGWYRGDAGDGGMITDHACDSPCGLTLRIGFSPGIFVGRAAHAPRQQLGRLWAERRSEGQPPRPAALGELDPLFASEVLRALDLLNPALARPDS